MLNPNHRTDDTVCAFLRLILPEEGPYAAYIVESNRKYNKFASTVEELLQKIKGADEAGQTAYHACAAFKEARQNPRNTPHGQRRYGRTKHNVRGSKSFWLDVDAGPDKPYLDWKAAALAVAEFCRTTKLPRPVVVLSGLGIHVYWPLVETLDPETWGRYARGLKALCSKYELQADPTRTADITSVLRTPGTHHRKAGIRLVQCGELFGPYALEQFAILLTVETVVREVAPRTSHRGHEFGPLPPYLANRPFEGVGETLRRSLSTIREPSFAKLIAERCEQVRALRDSKGNLSEPFWYACLGVLAFAEDGERLAHEWSKGDPRYTPDETQERLERLRQLSGATTCRRFHDLNPQVCERCKFWRKK